MILIYFFLNADALTVSLPTGTQTNQTTRECLRYQRVDQPTTGCATGFRHQHKEALIADGDNEGG